MNYYYITGTSRGIGKAIAKSLLEDHTDNRVIGISRNSTIIHDNYRHINLDLSDLKAVSIFSFDNLPDAKKIVLINNAGTLGEVKHLGNLSNEIIIKGLSVNMIAPTLLVNNYLSAYQNKPVEKIIINVTSGAAQNPYDGWGIYSPGKAAIDMLSKVADIEQKTKEYATTVLAIAPGVVATEMQTYMRELDEKDFNRKNKFIDLYEKNQLYNPKDVAKSFLKIINNPESVEGVINRISL